MGLMCSQQHESGGTPIVERQSQPYFVVYRTNLAAQKLTRQKIMNDNTNTIEKLTSLKMYQDYERAFSETTRLPVTLRPVESWQLPLHGKRNENPFCSLMAQKSRSCAACLQTQE